MSAGPSLADQRRVRVPARHVALVLLVVGLLLAPAPGVAAAARTSDSDESTALRLLEQAARSARDLTYTGTKYVAAWRPTGTSTALVEVHHAPGRGMVLTAPPTAADSPDDGLLLAATRLDAPLLRVLSDTYDLAVAGSGRCTGREADVVEARRPADGGGSVAGRFWVDRDSGLLLRREVYDDDGRRLRSSAFIDLDTAPAQPLVLAPSGRALQRDTGDPVPGSELAALRDDGWHIPPELPGGFALLESRSRAHGDGEQAGQVLHLAYTDGLSTTSLFVQRGELGGRPPDGFAVRQLGGHRVWVRDGAAERVVWAGGGRVWTLVSDAPESDVGAAVAALPHADLPDAGVTGRLARGLSRLGSWLNPFD